MHSSEYHIHSGHTDFAPLSTMFLFPSQMVRERFGKSNRDKAGKVGYRQHRPEEINYWVELVCS